MEFTIQRTTLKAALTTLRKAAGNRRGPPALRHVRIQVESGPQGKGQARFSITDLQTVLTFRADVSEAVPGAACLSIDELGAQLGGRGSGSIVFRVSSGKSVELVANGTSTKKLTRLPSSEMPPLPPMPRLAPVGGFLLGHLQRASSFCSTDETRAALQGVHLDRSRRHACLVASDGHRLIALPTGKLPSSLSESVTIPAHRLPAKVLAPVGDKVLVGADRKRFGFQNGPWEGSIELVEGAFPDWRQVLPKAGGSSRIIIPDDHLSTVAEFLAKLPATKNGNDPMALISRRRRLLVRYQNAGGKNEELEFPMAQAHGAAFQIVVNRGFLIDTLQAGFGIIGVAGTDQPLDIQSTAKGERVVLMPIRHTELLEAPARTVRATRPSVRKSQPRKEPTMSKQRTTETPSSPALVQQLQDACAVAKAMFRDGTNAVNEISALAKQLARAQKHSVSEVKAARKALAKLKTLSI